MTDQAVVKTAETTPTTPSESAAMLAMIERAARDPDVSIDKMERLFEMHRRADADRAKTVYLAALASLQAELPAVQRRGKSHNGSYARFEDLIEAVKAPLARHGFSLSFRCVQADKTITVTGILGHQAGHQEETSLPLPADNSGSKNIVQAWGSSLSYGKRYIALALLGIAAEDEDDDGQRAGAGPMITSEQAGEIRELVESLDGNTTAFCKYFRIEKVGDLPADKFNAAMAAIKKKQAAA